MAPSLLISFRAGHSLSRTDNEIETGCFHTHDECLKQSDLTIRDVVEPSSRISSSSSLNGNAYEIVGGTIGGVIFLVICILCVFLFLRSRRRKEGAPETNVISPLRVSFPTSKEAFTSPKYSHYGLTFSATPSPSKDSFTPLPQRLHKARINTDIISSVPTFHT
ncbi:hypothetical protein E4T56_gene8496 [Termitomyces sp. T112]|nr:hypothetical protein E4T56_gene8496 [Termitomyces sp. T112]